MNATLQNLLSICEAFTGPKELSMAARPEYVYKSCCENSGPNYLVILEKLEDTLTNEARTGVVDATYAKFRADKLKVVGIIDTSYPDKKPAMITHVNKDLGKSLVYIVGQIVLPDHFDPDIDVVCATGIHYFKSLEAAFFYNIRNTIRYTGPLKHWHDNGQLKKRYNYVNGEFKESMRNGTQMDI